MASPSNTGTANAAFEALRNRKQQEDARSATTVQTNTSLTPEQTAAGYIRATNPSTGRVETIHKDSLDNFLRATSTTTGHDSNNISLTDNAAYDTGGSFTGQRGSLSDLQNRVGSWQAPTSEGVDLASAARARAATIGPASRAAAGTASASTINEARAVAARDSAAQQAQAFSAQSRDAAAAQAGGTSIGRSEDQQIRQRQLGLLNNLEQAAAGNGPSVATEVGNAVANRAFRQNLAAVASAGGNAALAGGRVADMSAQQRAQAAQAARMQKFNEQVQARGELGQVAGATRSQDIGVNTEQAQLSQQVQLTNAAQRQQAALQNAQLSTQAALQNAQLATGVSQGNAQLGTQVSLANADRSLQAQTTTQQLQQQAALANQSSGLQASLANAQNTTAANLQNASQANQIAMRQAELSTDVSKLNATERNDMRTRQGELDLQTQIANMQQGLAGQQLTYDTLGNLIGADISLQDIINKDRQAADQARMERDIASNNLGR